MHLDPCLNMHLSFQSNGQMILCYQYLLREPERPQASIFLDSMFFYYFYSLYFYGVEYCMLF